MAVSTLSKIPVSRAGLKWTNVRATRPMTLPADPLASSAPTKRVFHSEDTPYSIPNDQLEWERLNQQYFGLKEYLGGRTTEAPLGNPESILELGAGSGIWAFEMAEQFPKAKVVAVDISEMDQTRMPANCTFQRINLTKEFPFAPKSFDVIHTRFLLVHLPNWKELVKQCITALKPGGLLLLEELTHCYECEDGPVPPEVNHFVECYNNYADARGVDSHTGSNLEGFLTASGAFSEVHCLNIIAAMTGYSDDKNKNQVGAIMRRSFTHAYSPLPERMPEYGITPDVYETWLREISNPINKVYMNMYWTWSRKA